LTAPPPLAPIDDRARWGHNRTQTAGVIEREEQSVLPNVLHLGVG